MATWYLGPRLTGSAKLLGVLVSEGRACALAWISAALASLAWEALVCVLSVCGPCCARVAVLGAVCPAAETAVRFEQMALRAGPGAS